MIPREAWERGIVLGGISAGSICWHAGGNTDSFGQLRAVTDSLGLLPHSTSVHYDSEPDRRPPYRSLVAEGTLGDGYATDDGVAIHYRGSAVERVIAAVGDRYAWRVSRASDGQALEERLEPELL